MNAMNTIIFFKTLKPSLEKKGLSLDIVFLGDHHTQINFLRGSVLVGVISSWTRHICQWSAIVINQFGIQTIVENSQSHDLQRTVNALLKAIENEATHV